MTSNTATNAILLVGVGFLGVIASNLTGAPIFGLAGFIAFVFAAAIAVGSLIRAFMDGLAEREPAPAVRRAPGSVKRRAGGEYSAAKRGYVS